MRAPRQWLVSASFAVLGCAAATWNAAPALGDGSAQKGIAVLVATATPAPPSGHAYAAACAKGNAKYAARDFPGAIEAYRAAVESSPSEPLGYYLLGEAQLAAANLPEAGAAWERALSFSNRDAATHARILFVIADLREREKKWQDARAAWQAYIDFVGQAPSIAAFASSAQSRQEAIDRMLKQDVAMEAVRRRIEETSDGGVYSNPDASPPHGI